MLFRSDLGVDIEAVGGRIASHNMDVKRTACGGRAFTGGDMNRFVSMYVCMYVCTKNEVGAL